MAKRGGEETRRDGRVARRRAALAHAVVQRGPGGMPAVGAALRDYVLAAREAGLGARAVLAEVDRAWHRAGSATRLLTRDVLEVATLLELSAGDGAPRGARSGR